MKLPNIITGVMMIVALGLSISLVNMTKDQQIQQVPVLPVVKTDGIVVTEEKSVVLPAKPVVTHRVQPTKNDTVILGQPSGDELVGRTAVKVDGKWQIGVDQDPRLVRVDIKQQRLYYYRGGKLIYKFKCSTSITGKVMPSDQHPDTPHDHIGVFFIGAKYVKRWSREWKVWMPWALQYIGGHYIHGTTEVQNLGSAASHGCIRLHPRDAKLLYSEVRVGDRVEAE